MSERGRAPRWYLLGCLLSAGGYAAASLLVRSDHSAQDFSVFLLIFSLLSLLWAAALWLARGSPPRLGWIFAAAVVFRLLLLPAGFDSSEGAYRRLILYDDDVWRYLWEGHVWAVGVNPLRVPPEALEEFELELEDPVLYQRLYGGPVWSTVYDNIGYREFASPYPYTAQAVFRLAHWLQPGSVLVFKLLIIGFDLGVIGLLAGLCRRLGQNNFAVLAYAWNPLVIKEFAGSAHIDAVLLFFLLAAVSAAGLAGSVWLVLSALVKPTPLAFVPALYRRLGWWGVLLPAGALAVIAVAPPEGMKAYAQYWTFNAGLSRFLLGNRVLEVAVPLLAVAAVALWRYRSDDGSLNALVSQGVWLLGAFLLTTPMVAPWYLTWILPFAALQRAWFWLAFSGSIFLSYHAYLRMAENLWVVGLEYAIPVGIWLWMRARAGRRQTVAESGPLGVT